MATKKPAAKASSSASKAGSTKKPAKPAGASGKKREPTAKPSKKPAPAAKPAAKAKAESKPKPTAKAPAAQSPAPASGTKKSTSKSTEIKVPETKAPGAKAGGARAGGSAKAPAAASDAKKSGKKPEAAPAKPAAAEVPKDKQPARPVEPQHAPPRVDGRRPMIRKKPEKVQIPVPASSLLKLRKSSGGPLIPSGPNAKPAGRAIDIDNPHETLKTPFNKKQLDEFRQILLAKRAQLLGDLSNIEQQALQSDGGGLSNMPQHMAEQGSDAYDQSLSLDLAAADRELIKEIDEALNRIEDGTFGVCPITGKPIKMERLRELPWAKYSIEAAREFERRRSLVAVVQRSSAAPTDD